MADKRYGRLIHLRPRADTIFVSQGRDVLATGRDGFVTPGTDQGFYAFQTRLIDTYRWSLADTELLATAISNVDQDTCLAYYVASPPGAVNLGLEEDDPAQQTIELRVSRLAGGGLHEDVDLTNYSRHPVSLRLELAIRPDLAWPDAELARVTGPVWLPDAADGGMLHFRYHVARPYDHQGDRGVARIHDGFDLVVAHGETAPDYADGRLVFRIDLPVGGTWHTCLDLMPVIDGERSEPPRGCYAFLRHDTERAVRQALFTAESTRFRSDSACTLATTVIAALERAKEDLAALRLYDLDADRQVRNRFNATSPEVEACLRRDLLARKVIGPDGHGRAWTMAAGLPAYVALYGRDTLTAAWQAALLSPDMLKGTLPAIADRQARQTDDWRDAQPGKLLHEAQTNRAARLMRNPSGNYFGAITTSGFFPFAVSALWHWSGDRALVDPYLDAALKALRWLDRYARHDDGFYYYRTASVQGHRHQGWKDSSDAIVTADGLQVDPPIATCEEQAFVYVAKLHLADVLWWLGDREAARRSLHEASELKKRFNERFWLPELGFVAMALDSRGHPVRSIGSNAGHCLATGIVDSSLVRQLADRLMASDLFSGWGIRTLSSAHPEYNPYSYHRGSVWPVEQGTFTMAFFRHGLWRHLHTLAKAQFEAAGLFESYRLPEVFSGHPRDELHPFPALYPRTNWPQAWSSSSLFCHLQAMLGLYPYAPLHLLVIDPHLPDWLPQFALHGLRVGDARVSLDFRRQANGRTTYRILDVQGRLKVIRQPSPWSASATFGERALDLLSSLARSA